MNNPSKKEVTVNMVIFALEKFRNCFTKMLHVCMVAIFA